MSTVLAHDAAAATDFDLAIERFDSAGTRLLIVRPKKPGAVLRDHVTALRELAAKCLSDTGNILFRGFDNAGATDFRNFAAGLGRELLSYDFGSTPRSRIEQGVYSSTEYPAHQWIPQHNEQSYTLKWPGLIWFHCDIAPAHGGETPIADSREVHRRIDPSIRRRFSERGLMYVRNYGNGLDLDWQQVFQTSERSEVETYCRANRIEWQWLDDEGLRTRQCCQSELRHPATGEMVWFNQAHLFHVSSLAPEVRSSLLEIFAEDELPRNVYYGDGQAIEDSVLDDIRGHYDDVRLSFPWVTGDVLMLDNLLCSHGRAPFEGPRRILVAMAA